MTLRTEGDLLRRLATGTYTVQGLYQRAERAGLADRPGGRKRIQDGKEQYQRRVRTALQGLRRQGKAYRVEHEGQPTWFIEGIPAVPSRALFVWLPSDPSQLELVVGAAADVLAQSDEPYALIVADPPWGLRRDDSDPDRLRAYGRDQSRVLGGYVDWDPVEYAERTHEWMAVAAKTLRPGGYLAVVTGAQQSARVQITGEDLGLTYVNSIAVRRTMGMYCTRRYVHAHNRITLMTAGQLDSTLRTFDRPTEMPRGRTGEIYAVDVWDDIPDFRAEPTALRYDNALHPKLVSRVVRSTTRPGDLVADPFIGSGTTPLVCLQLGRRFFGGDLNPLAVQFAMARVLADAETTMPIGATS